MLLSSFLKVKFVSLFSHAFALMGSYAFFSGFFFQFIFGNNFTHMFAGAV